MNPPADFIFTLAHEDVPYSLIPLASIVEQLGIEVPTIRAMMQFHSLINERDYQEEAVTAENLGFAGMTPEQIRKYVQEGSR
jgi:opine dehydrogenase